MSQIKSTAIKDAESTARAARYENGFRVLQGRREYVTYMADSSIRIWYSDIPWRYESHDHSAVEVLLTLEGSVTYTVEDKLYHVVGNHIEIETPEPVVVNVDGEALYSDHINFTLVPAAVNFIVPKGLKLFAAN